jgi:hypothetical protein
MFCPVHHKANVYLIVNKNAALARRLKMAGDYPVFTGAFSTADCG